MYVDELIDELKSWKAPNAEVLMNDSIDISRVTSLGGNKISLLPISSVSLEDPEDDIEDLESDIEELEDRLDDYEAWGKNIVETFKSLKPHLLKCIDRAKSEDSFFEDIADSFDDFVFLVEDIPDTI